MDITTLLLGQSPFLKVPIFKEVELIQFKHRFKKYILIKIKAFL